MCAVADEVNADSNREEATVMKRVAHPHVCNLHDHQLLSGGALFGMCIELLEGGTLEQVLRQEPQSRLREFDGDLWACAYEESL